MSAVKSRLRRWVGFLLSVSTTILFGYSAVTHFGALRIVALVVLSVLLTVNLLDGSFHWTPRLIVAAGATYAMLMLGDLLLWASAPSVNPELSTRGLYADDDELGYGLNPNWTGVYVDDVVRGARYTINDLGQRDQLPVGSGSKRVLLLGDSFTFGELLDDRETIDRQVESLSQHEFDAYNLGVPGYGARACEKTFARTPHAASHALYLFYENDLRNDGQATERNGVWRGFLVSRQNRNGHVRSDAYLDAKIDKALATPCDVCAVPRLQHLVKSILRVRRVMRNAVFAELELSDHDPMGYRRSNVAQVVAHTEEMRELARKRGMEFAVLVLPSIQEAGNGQHYALVREFMTELGSRGIATLDPLAQFSSSDFFVHNSHFNRQGARKAAEAIVEWLQPANGE